MILVKSRAISSAAGNRYRNRNTIRHLTSLLVWWLWWRSRLDHANDFSDSYHSEFYENVDDIPRTRCVEIPE